MRLVVPWEGLLGTGGSHVALGFPASDWLIPPENLDWGRCPERSLRAFRWAVRTSPGTFQLWRLICEEGMLASPVGARMRSFQGS